MKCSDEKQFIVVTRFDAKWTDNKIGFRIMSDKTFLKLTVNFLVVAFDNSFSIFATLSF